MKLKRFKERDNKRIGIIVFTIVCILLVCGAVLYRTFAIFEVKTNQNVINGEVQSMGDIEFAFYQDDGSGDKIVKEAPKKGEGYSLDTSSSYCVDLLNDEQVSNVNWDYENWEVRVKNVNTTKTKCYLHFKKIYKDTVLNGADPDLMNGRLVPVKISDKEKPTGSTYVGPNAGGQVTKADITQEWYNYGSKTWANAVILKSGVEDNYKPGDEIKEEDIESYFVWIPRYKYKLQESESTYTGYTSVTAKGNQANVQSFYNTINGNKGANTAFDIVFETKNNTPSTGATQNTYITHPAFLSFNSNGLWVGKFETGYNQNSDNTSVMPATPDSWSYSGAQQNTEASTKVIIKPNVYSWRNIQVANAFYTAYNYKRDLESHMMKNMEWGAVAYLTQSKYGMCTEGDGSTTCGEVRINNVGTYITGSASNFEPTCGYTGTKESCNSYESLYQLGMNGGVSNNYYNSDSTVASTTGNYSGIYDMAGGAWEYVMGVMQSSQTDATPTSGRNQLYNSGFKGKYSCYNCDSQSATENTSGKEWPSSKYYDLYEYSTSDQQFQRGHLGDGTKEFGPFYSVNWPKSDGSYNLRRVGSYNSDDAFFVYSYYPWFRRGGNFADGTDAGLAAFNNSNGHAGGTHSFRVVCAA